MGVEGGGLPHRHRTSEKEVNLENNPSREYVQIFGGHWDWGLDPGCWDMKEKGGSRKLETWD